MTRPQLPHGARHAVQAAWPSSAQTPACAVQCWRRHDGHTRTCSSHAGWPSTRHWTMPCSAQKSSAQTEQRCEQASQLQCPPSWRHTTSVAGGAPHRSEEHTSELQSHHDLVCRLLLEKKKTKKSIIKRNQINEFNMAYNKIANRMHLFLDKRFAQRKPIAAQ